MAESFRGVVATGAYFNSLEATRDAIAEDLENCESMRDKAALYLRLSDVLSKIETARPPAVRGDAVDEISARRDARRERAATGTARAERTS